LRISFSDTFHYKCGCKSQHTHTHTKSRNTRRVLDPKATLEKSLVTINKPMYIYDLILKITFNNVILYDTGSLIAKKIADFIFDNENRNKNSEVFHDLSIVIGTQGLN
jgi:hypothetical protein